MAESVPAEGPCFSPSLVGEGASSFAAKDRSNLPHSASFGVRSGSRTSAVNAAKEEAAALPEGSQWIEGLPSGVPSPPWSRLHTATTQPPAAAAPAPAAAAAAGGLPAAAHGGVLLPSREISGAGCCVGGGESSSQVEIHPSNLHALIPSKFKYKFPKERLPRHSSYEVLAVEDNPYASPLPPPPPKVPHKKKSIFGIARRHQQQQQQQQQQYPLLMRPPAAPAAAAAAAEAAGESKENAGKGWIRDFRCFLCTSADYVSDEQTQLEIEKAQLEEALIEFQSDNRAQAIQLEETKTQYEKQIQKKIQDHQHAYKFIEETKQTLKQIQQERDQLLEQQKQ
ncbi:uncharacterized protein EMH_0081590 [Eimeria mitis]|uniref:Uncharacterized protein n=1 Tax=Eimeria mitis TaxID=44415 RepID=U6KCT5_9EIME|nr:uncharacterized protein EMH_0081590 [Eimeria mitis]CDJ33293.1 hypothetical protein, conserved [Eimeria mitis]